MLVLPILAGVHQLVPPSVGLRLPLPHQAAIQVEHLAPKEPAPPQEVVGWVVLVGHQAQEPDLVADQAVQASVARVSPLGK